MAAVTTEREELLVSLLGDIGPLAVIGIVQAALGCVLDEIERRRGVVRLAACAAGSCCLSTRRRSAGIGCRRCSGRGFVVGLRRRFISRAAFPRERAHSYDKRYSQKSRSEFAHRSFPYPSCDLIEPKKSLVPRRLLANEARFDGPVLGSYCRPMRYLPAGAEAACVGNAGAYCVHKEGLSSKTVSEQQAEPLQRRPHIPNAKRRTEDETRHFAFRMRGLNDQLVTSKSMPRSEERRVGKEC